MKQSRRNKKLKTLDTPWIETGLMIYLIIYLLGFAKTIHTLTTTIYMTLT